MASQLICHLPLLQVALCVCTNISVCVIKSQQRPEMRKGLEMPCMCMIIKESKGVFKILDTSLHLLFWCDKKFSTFIKILSSSIPRTKYFLCKNLSLLKNPGSCNFIDRQLEGTLAVETKDMRRTSFVTFATPFGLS